MRCVLYVESLGLFTYIKNIIYLRRAYVCFNIFFLFSLTLFNSYIISVCTVSYFIFIKIIIRNYMKIWTHAGIELVLAFCLIYCMLFFAAFFPTFQGDSYSIFFLCGKLIFIKVENVFFLFFENYKSVCEWIKLKKKIVFSFEIEECAVLFSYLNIFGRKFEQSGHRQPPENDSTKCYRKREFSFSKRPIFPSKCILTFPFTKFSFYESFKRECFVSVYEFLRMEIIFLSTNFHERKTFLHY